MKKVFTPFSDTFYRFLRFQVQKKPNKKSNKTPFSVHARKPQTKNISFQQEKNIQLDDGVKRKMKRIILHLE